MALVQNGSEPASPRVARLTRRTEDTPITALGCSYVISAPNNVGGQNPPQSFGSNTWRRRIAILENLVDHANVGSAFRNAAALGIDGVLITPACADPLYRRAVKTSMGNVFNVPWTRGPKMPEMLDGLKADGYTTVAFTLSDDAITLDDLVAQDLPAIAMVFGTEGAGVDARTAKQVDMRVKIPMEDGVDSLNVAAATAVAFYATR